MIWFRNFGQNEKHTHRTNFSFDYSTFAMELFQFMFIFHAVSQLVTQILFFTKNLSW